MAAHARRRGLEVEVAPFETWEPAGRAFDAVVAAQAWHWVDPVAGAAKAAEALRPGGLLVACWNVPDPSPEVAAAFAAVYRRVLRDWNPWERRALDAYDGIVAKIADGVRVAGAFAEPERWRFDWEGAYTRREWLDRLATGGDVARFSPAELRDVLAGIGAAIDALGGSVTMRYAALALVARRL